MAVVERACRICVDVQESLFSAGGIIEKNDQTPVTVADFGVQALISLELSKLFPLIPLVAEEDSGFLRANNLVDSVVEVVSDKANSGDNVLSQDDVLEAIDRGGKGGFDFRRKPATYWILDPIDGTKGFVKGGGALYVVGLALIVEGEIVLNVMGCPNWLQDSSCQSSAEVPGYDNSSFQQGIIMIAHAGCGTWTKNLLEAQNISAKDSVGWKRCFVDDRASVCDARYCIPDSQTWDLIPLSAFYEAKTDADDIGDKEIVLLSACCGSLCKYLMVASGRASVFMQQVRPQRVYKAWDHAPGMLCVHEAGGKVTDWNGSELDICADQAERRIVYPTGGILVTNNNVHVQILEMISSSPSIV